MLDDAIDAVSAARPAALMAPETPYNAVNHTDGLRIVDILDDEGIWVCLDEGCNSNCHGTGWRERNAEAQDETTLPVHARKYRMGLETAAGILWHRKF